jgi:hypothetical protein
VAVLVSAIARGRRWLDEVVSGRVTTVVELCAREKCSVRQINMTISLAFLAPNLVKAAAEDRQWAQLMPPIPIMLTETFASCRWDQADRSGKDQRATGAWSLAARAFIRTIKSPEVHNTNRQKPAAQRRPEQRSVSSWLVARNRPPCPHL